MAVERRPQGRGSPESSPAAGSGSPAGSEPSCQGPTGDGRAKGGVFISGSLPERRRPEAGGGGGTGVRRG